MSRRPSVRRVLIVGTLIVLALALTGAGAVAWQWARSGIDTTGEITFTRPLPIPPLLEPSTDADGRLLYDLDLTAGTSELVAGTITETWGYNGNHLGPTLRAARGDQVIVNVTNNVDESTTLHWHGMNLPAVMDGGPHQLIDPGGTWTATWTVDQPAATLWYHPHPHHRTADQVYRGAAGMFLVDDPGTTDPDLPDTYGIDDIPLIIQDKALADDGTLVAREPTFGGLGILGDRVVVNGIEGGYLDLASELVRLRVVNASPGRSYDLGLSDDRPCWLIGTDSSLLPEPHRTDRIQVSPGERVEILVELESGADPVLRSYPPDLGQDPFSERFNGGDDTFDLVELRTADKLTPADPVPAQLVSLDRIDPATADRTRTFELSGVRINGRRTDLDRIDEVVPAGSTEIWEVTNAGGSPHNFHPHLIHFQILDLDGEPPPPHLTGWKDTIQLPPGTTARLVAHFDAEPDPDHPFMFHCHILGHEDAGMMGQFTVE